MYIDKYDISKIFYFNDFLLNLNNFLDIMNLEQNKNIIFYKI